MIKAEKIEKAYGIAQEIYDEAGVNTEEALRKLDLVSLSLPCWQGDDVTGFERSESRGEKGGIQITGSYPGRARSVEELRMDLEKAYSFIPGSHRLSLHSIYGEFGDKPVARDEMSPEHFEGWVNWSHQNKVGLDFNATCFSHPLAASGFTLSHEDSHIRKFWMAHVQRCREISARIGRQLMNPCIHNLWIPDGMKDMPVDRWTPRSRLKEALDEIYDVEYPEKEMKDSLEPKLFGIGSESYVVGSYEFYYGYAQSRGKMICLDSGHFHPTESLADKVSAILLFFNEIMFHLSRGIRWDSDHIVIQNDEIQNIAEEIVICEQLKQVHIGLDFFDASLNRVGAWVIGARATLKSFLKALLLPLGKLRSVEKKGDFFVRLALREEAKTYPLGAVWDYYCLLKDTPPRDLWIKDIERYESEVLNRRG
jgi:L-rhamnose isomerase